MIDYTEPKKNRVNFTLSQAAINKLNKNIRAKKRSAFIDFLITRYTESETANFNYYGFSKSTVDVISRNDKKPNKNTNRSELIAELNLKVDELASYNKNQRHELLQIAKELPEPYDLKTDLETLKCRVGLLRNE